MYSLSLKEFQQKAREGNLIPVYREILADMETPVFAFQKIRQSEYAFLLESVEGGEKWARYSFLSFAPSIIIRAYGKKVEITRDGKTETRVAERDALEVVSAVLGQYKPVTSPELPRFIGGAVGYVGYDVVKQFERLPDENRDDLRLPDILLMVTDRLIVFDNVTHKTKVICNAFVPEGTSGEEMEAIYSKALSRVDEVVEMLRPGRLPEGYLSRPKESSPVDKGFEISDPVFSGVTSNVSREQFEGAVSRIIDYVKAGDVIQVVLAQRFQTETSADPFNVYRALRTINPSPYMFFLQLGDVHLAGSSPEVLVRLENDEIGVRPIAGTRHRGADEEEDLRLSKDLLADPKEIAEHVMLVDLGRNDVGRVAKSGSVRVDDLMIIEKYSHVLHIVSSVTGELKDGLDMYEVFRSCFPAGTLSGAAKIRAMEIIEELETTRRGPYGGAVGFFSFSGNMDTCITIRTIVMKDGYAYIQAGAGVVADSVPEREYQETLNKARGMVHAIRLAERGLE